LMLLGLGAGIMAATTIYMVAWLGGILASLFFYYFLQKQSWKKTVSALLITGFSGIAGFFLAVLPVITRMPRFWRWIISILTHQSNYLAVAKDEPMATRMVTNFLYLYDLLPYLVISALLLLGLALIAALLMREDKRIEKNGLLAMAWGVSMQIILISLTFLDRPIRPYYFLSVASMIPFLALCVLRMFANKAWISKSLNWILIISVIFGLSSTTIKSFSYKQFEINSFTASSVKVDEIVQQYAQLTNRASKDIVILWMYGTYSQCWRLWFGNRASADAFTKEIVSFCPNQYEFMGQVSTPHHRTPLEKMNWDIIFTCEKYVDAVTAKDQTAVVQQYPDIEWTCGRMAVIYNK
jgi:hypothetical protein